MPGAWLWPASFVLSALTAYRLTPSFIALFRHSGHLKPNHRQTMIPQGIGILFALCSLPWYALHFAVARTSPNTGPLATPILFSLVAVSLLGFIDDMLGSRTVSGLAGHARALLAGSLTTGIIKAAGTVFIALIISSVLYTGSLRIIVSTFILALFANLFNLFDLRPGRAIKFFLLSLLIIGAKIVIWKSTSAALSPAAILPFAGAVVGYFPFDLQAKAMMGDAGSNALGICTGLLVVSQCRYQAQIATLIVLIALHLLAERYSLTTIIANNAILRLFDELGRQN